MLYSSSSSSSLLQQLWVEAPGEEDIDGLWKPPRVGRSSCDQRLEEQREHSLQPLIRSQEVGRTSRRPQPEVGMVIYRCVTAAIIHTDG